MPTAPNTPAPPPPTLPVADENSHREEMSSRRRLLPYVVLLVGVAVAVVLLLVPAVSSGTQGGVAMGGAMPQSAIKGVPLTLDLAVDNSYGSTLDPLCLSVGPRRNFNATAATVQGIDKLTFHNNRACGEELVAGEDVSVTVTVVPQFTGTLPLTIGVVTPSGTEVGSPIAGNLHVATP